MRLVLINKLKKKKLNICVIKSIIKANQSEVGYMFSNHAII
jgi:hypothetical protein